MNLPEFNGRRKYDMFRQIHSDLANERNTFIAQYITLTATVVRKRDKKKLLYTLTQNKKVFV